MNIKDFLVPPGKKVKLSDFDPDFTGSYTKSDAKKKLKDDKKKLRQSQNRLYSEGDWAVVVLIQGLDGSKKDSTIEAVFEDVNPNGYTVVSYKAPSSEDLEHDFLRRHLKDLPRRGRILVSNRTWYEEVLVVRVHPEFLNKQKLPKRLKGRGIWKRRFRSINDVERYLRENGFLVIKILLNASKKVRAKRLRERMEKPSKCWKFSLNDARELKFDSKYRRVIEAMLSNTSTEHAPWYVVPSDHKHFTRAAVAHIIIKAIESLKPEYPKTTRQQHEEMRLAKRLLKRTIKGE